MPDSVLVLVFAIALFALAMFVSSVLVEPTSGAAADAFYLSIVVSVTGYVLYWIVLAVTGYARRVVPTIAAIMACGSILTVLMVAAYVMLNPFLGANIAAIVAWLILMWSVPVKGHIIARAIAQHWYVGIAIALAIYIMQRVAFDTLTANPGG